MTPRVHAPGLEPSAEAVQAARERLRALGVLLTDDATRDLLRLVLSIEGGRLDRETREAVVARLRSIQEGARETLALLTPAPGATVPMPAVQVPPPPRPAPAPRRDQPVNLAEIVRQRLGEDAPRPEPVARTPEPPPQPPAPPRVPAEPRRPVFKRPRGR